MTTRWHHEAVLLLRVKVDGKWERDPASQSRPSPQDLLAQWWHALRGAGLENEMLGQHS